MNIDLDKDQLKQLVEKLSWNDGFGCYTRAGFEKMVWPVIFDRARWIIYFDIDGMHELNESFGGYEAVDAMVKRVLESVRASDFVAGQWKSGDEFLVCLTESDGRGEIDPQGLVSRLIRALKQHGMSATFAVVPVKAIDLAANVLPAVSEVYAAKKMKGDSR